MLDDDKCYREKKARGRRVEVQKCLEWMGDGVITVLNKAAKTDLTEMVIKTNLSKDPNRKKVRE